MGLRADLDRATAGRELHRVVQKLIQRPDEQLGVPHDRRDAGADLPHEAMSTVALAPLVRQTRDQVLHRDRFDARLQPAGFHRGEVHEDLDDAFESPGRLQDPR